jgi:hypothetical protein
MGHFFAGCLQELKSTMFCIIDGGSCPYLKRREGNTKTFMYTFSVNFSVIIFLFLIVQKNIEGLYKRIHILMIL